MNSDAKRISSTFRRNLDTIKRDAAGMDDAKANRQMGQGSSLNWVVGHMLSSRLRVLDQLSKTVDGLDVAKLRATYGRDTHPDPATAWALADLLNFMELSQIELEEGLIATDLTPEIDTPFGKQPLENYVDFFGWHEGFHTGQVVLFKRWLEG